MSFQQHIEQGMEIGCIGGIILGCFLFGKAEAQLKVSQTEYSRRTKNNEFYEDAYNKSLISMLSAFASVVTGPLIGAALVAAHYNFNNLGDAKSTTVFFVTILASAAAYKNGRGSCE